MNLHLELLLSAVYDGAVAPAHQADLHQSSLTDDTIARQKIRSIPPAMIARLLGFESPQARSAYLIPFPDPRGGWLDHVRMKVFPPIETETGTIKYLQPRRSGVRIYLPLATLDAVLRTADPLYVVEGEKKALAVAQLDHPAIGICGIEGWHVADNAALHPDLDDVGLRGRVVNLVPDADVQTNPAVARAVQRLVTALHARGVAEVRRVIIPPGFKGIDDYLAATA
jgi:uncharacterized protein DUF3854